MENDPVTYEMIGAAIEVHRIMGPGLLESVYQLCLEEELKQRGVHHLPQERVPLNSKGRDLEHTLKMDIVLPGQLVVELKSVEKLIPVHEAQLLTYLKLSGIKTGLLINFNVSVLKHGIKRMVN